MGPDPKGEGPGGAPNPKGEGPEIEPDPKVEGPDFFTRDLMFKVFGPWALRGEPRALRGARGSSVSPGPLGEPGGLRWTWGP